MTLKVATEERLRLSHEEPIKIMKPNSHLADPAPLAMAGFATTLLTVSLAMMNFRGVSVQTMFVGNLCFVACIGLLISAQWAMVQGDTFTYTVLTAFGLFYGGYGAVMIPSFGVVDAYGGYTPEFYNAFGFFILIWGVLNLFFLLSSIRISIVYIIVFVCIEFCLVLDGTSQFVKADGHDALYVRMQKAAGAFGFVAGLLGYYSTAHYLCEDALGFKVPMGDTSNWSLTKRKSSMDKDLEA
ncbi:hypothetical protein NQ176_g9311 [Zarea fungicola]|uniref:Uncharacterized protein n=1 Tax=Zarea fungicola TaxID=93591 RepID=A0ACC1MMD7_9HYPO|nr:hypothetical protein NQ176_g9311 [Lecanicillium fungicola]